MGPTEAELETERLTKKYELVFLRRTIEIYIHGYCVGNSARRLGQKKSHHMHLVRGKQKTHRKVGESQWKS